MLDTASGKPQEGEAFAVGPGRVDDNGQRVRSTLPSATRSSTARRGGTEVKYAGAEYHLRLGGDARGHLLIIHLCAALRHGPQHPTCNSLRSKHAQDFGI
ncbi:MAG: hypothetical protein R2693_03265 [Nocardioidaceae bacterium]